MNSKGFCTTEADGFIMIPLNLQTPHQSLTSWYCASFFVEAIISPAFHKRRHGYKKYCIEEPDVLL